jgi:hypothetical protein
VGGNISYGLPKEDGTRFQFGPDINKALTADSACIADYDHRGIVRSWTKSFSSPDGILKSFQVSFGTAYSYNDEFFIRAGYFYEDETHRGRRYISTGIGDRYKTAMVNISYIIPSGNGINRSALSNTLCFGVMPDLPSK